MKKMDVVFKIILLVMLWGGVSESWAACRFVGYDDGKYAGVNISGSTITETSSVTNGSWGRGYNITDIYDNAAATIRIGNIHLMDSALQPPGSVLAHASVPPTEYKVRNANPERLIWACSPATNMDNVVFLTSVNGDDRVGGYYEVNETSGTAATGNTPNVYYTWFRGVGIRQMMNGTVLTPKWTAIPLTGYETGDSLQSVGWARDKCQPGWKCIRLRHLPTLEFELIRVTGQPPLEESSANQYCNRASETVPSGTPSSSINYGMGNSGPYLCNQPSSYITLGSINTVGAASTGNADVAFDHDGIGVRHTKAAGTWKFWDSSNGFGYTLFKGVNLINDTVTCKLNTVTSMVDFGATTTNYLNNNVVSRNFNVNVDCSDSFVPGGPVAIGKVAIGIQPSQGAYDAIKNNTSLRSNLYNGDTYQSVKALVDDNYGATGSAQNVGIYIKYQGAGSYLNLLGQPGATGTILARNWDDAYWGHTALVNSCGSPGVYNQNCYPGVTYPTGANAGWYPVLDTGHYTSVGSPLTGYTTYTIPYTADLKKIDPALPVTAGTIKSTAYVVIKVQ